MKAYLEDKSVFSVGHFQGGRLPRFCDQKAEDSALGLTGFRRREELEHVASYCFYQTHTAALPFGGPVQTLAREVVNDAFAQWLNYQFRHPCFAPEQTGPVWFGQSRIVTSRSTSWPRQFYFIRMLFVKQSFCLAETFQRETAEKWLGLVVLGLHWREFSSYIVPFGIRVIAAVIGCASWDTGSRLPRNRQAAISFTVGDWVAGTNWNSRQLLQFVVVTAYKEVNKALGTFLVERNETGNLRFVVEMCVNVASQFKGGRARLSLANFGPNCHIASICDSLHGHFQIKKLRLDRSFWIAKRLKRSCFSTERQRLKLRCTLEQNALEPLKVRNQVVNNFESRLLDLSISTVYRYLTLIDC